MTTVDEDAKEVQNLSLMDAPRRSKPPWPARARLAELIHALEIGTIQAEDRPRAARALLLTAEACRRTPYEGYGQFTVNALRRYGTLVLEADIQTLMPFLEDPYVSVRQTALQAIEAVLYRSLPTVPQGRLVGRVRELEKVYLDDDVMLTPEMRSLAASTAVALSLLAPSDSVSIAHRLRLLGRSGVIAVVGGKWKAMISVRDPSQSVELERAVGVLEGN